ncbi:electron transfer flavoprotein subunit beta/FixA family protein [Candidatus Woesearchaeota archaeon]|nr:electron transfer flavoprotein subunit beta/FixA family protein [Candidatus Woesearchaeota archaeon]
MKIIVCIKQVPDTNKVKINPKTGTLVREGVKAIMNPEDKHALIEAVRIKKDHGAKVAALSMGPPQAEDVLREALALGADEAILLCDRAFAGSDTWATANAIGAAVRSIGDCSLLLFGRQAIDGDTAQVGPQVAEFLNMPQITYARKIEIIGDKVRVERQMEDGYEIIESKMPCLITCMEELNKMEYPSLGGIREAYMEKKVNVLGMKDIGADSSTVGLLSSPTSVKRSFTPPPKGSGQMIKGSAKEAADKIVSLLKEKEMVGAF